MKLLSTFLVAWSTSCVAGQTACDISSLLDANGNWGTHKIRLPLGRSYDNLQLTNKGKFKKQAGEFHHRNSGSYSDGWVSCNQQGHKTMHYLRCDTSGRLYVGPNVPSMVGGVMDNTVTLPDCSRTCDSNQLGVYQLNHTPCPADKCWRYCSSLDRNHRTRTKVQCRCDWASNTCNYKTKSRQGLWVDFVDSNEDRYSSCAQQGQWGSWSQWSSCSVTCGGGSQDRTRVCSIPNNCSGTDTETQTCNPQACPTPAPLGWSSWTAWSGCSVTCDGGFRDRSRSCLNTTAQGPCPGPQITQEMETCNQQTCPPPTGTWDQWSTWSSCSVTCDDGNRTRTRTCSVTGGCSGTDTENEVCNDGTCPVGCDPDDLPVHAADDPNTAVWTCSNGNLHGSVCTKSCTATHVLAGKKTDSTCDCNAAGTCRWKGQVSPCAAKQCTFQGTQSLKELWWVKMHFVRCVDPNGGIHVPADGLSLPVGTICSPHCPPDWVIQGGMHGGGSDSTAFVAQSVCECEGKTCKYSNRKMVSCVPGVCSSKPNLHDFEDGFSHSGAALSNFNPDFVSCTNIMPATHPDPQIAGKPALGSKCSIECATGFSFYEDDTGKYGTYTNGKLELECINREHGVLWDIYQDVWGNYGDCFDDWTAQPENCHMYPQCVPTGQHIPPTTGRKKRDLDFENFEF